MKTNLPRWIVALALVLGLLTTAPAQQPVQLAADQLKSEAFKALKDGKYDRTSELLTEAIGASHDPSLTRISDWVQQFISQRQDYFNERKKGFDKAEAEAHKLLAGGYTDTAIDRAKDAFLFAADKEEFKKLPWVADLMAQAKKQAAEAEAKSQWFRAQRLYSDLGSVEPTSALWKEKFKSVTTRLRILAMYTPDDFRKTVDDEVKRREAAELFVNPTTQPATKPANEENDSFRTDWRDMLRDVKMDMLVDALGDARKGYWKQVNYRTMINGGIKGLRTLVTTQGVEKAFTGLANQAKSDAFLSALNDCADIMVKASPLDEERRMREVLDRITKTNNETIHIPEEVLVSEFADGAFAELDPFSTMIWPSDWDEFLKSTQGEFTGVGIQIQSDEDGNLKVVSPLEDSPAWNLKIKPGDVITRINGKSAKNISINQAVKNITGPENTMVTLTIKSPDGVVKDYPIVRQIIKVPSVKGYRHMPGGGWDYSIDTDQKIAYLRMTNFTRTTDEELARALEDLKKQGTRAIILDLRNNPGGLLQAAEEVCDKFLSSGKIVSTRGEREINIQPPYEAKRSDDDVTLPLVVMVNQFSASASEIVSGALQDHHRALIVGERTFGKGSVQMLFQLDTNKAALKLTTSHYYLPSGRSIHKEDTAEKWGVDPDWTVEMTGEQMRAAQEARIEMEILREKGELPTVKRSTEPPGSGKVSIPADQNGNLAPTSQPAKKDLLASDPQLSAAVLLLKLQLAGASL